MSSDESDFEDNVFSDNSLDDAASIEEHSFIFDEITGEGDAPGNSPTKHSFIAKNGMIFKFVALSKHSSNT